MPPEQERQTQLLTISPPWTATLTLDRKLVGPFEVHALALDSASNFGKAAVGLNITLGDYKLESITEISPEPVHLFAESTTKKLRVTGLFRNNADDTLALDITENFDTLYESTNPGIARVDGATGLVTAVSPGKAKVMITNGSIRREVVVSVVNAYFWLELSDTDLEWQQPVPDIVSYDVVTGDLIALRNHGGDFAHVDVGLQCYTSEAATTSMGHGPDPATPGATSFFLARARNTIGPLPYDSTWSWRRANQAAPRTGINQAPGTCP